MEFLAANTIPGTGPVHRGPSINTYSKKQRMKEQVHTPANPPELRQTSQEWIFKRKENKTKQRPGKYRDQRKQLCKVAGSFLPPTA